MKEAGKKNFSLWSKGAEVCGDYGRKKKQLSEME
jgi:hypothetical protein